MFLYGHIFHAFCSVDSNPVLLRMFVSSCLLKFFSFLFFSSCNLYVHGFPVFFLNCDSSVFRISDLFCIGIFFHWFSVRRVFFIWDVLSSLYLEGYCLCCTCVVYVWV